MLLLLSYILASTPHLFKTLNQFTILKLGQEKREREKELEEVFGYGRFGKKGKKKGYFELFPSSFSCLFLPCQ